MAGSKDEVKVKAKKSGKPATTAAREPRLPKKLYETELFRLQAELVKLQEWVRAEQARIVVIFEGRDAAGKGSTIKRVAQYLNPRVAQITALPAPTEREQTEWYFQRYIEHLPSGGQIVLFDRSWYNRAGVERVMGFCTKEEYTRFLHQCPIFERLLTEEGILLRKYWFSVSDEEQQLRFRSRLEDPDAAVEALPDGPGVRHPVGGLLAGEGRDVRAHRHPGGPVECRGERRQAAGQDQHDRPPAVHDSVPRRPADAAVAAVTAAVTGIPAGAQGHADVRARPRSRSHPRGAVIVTGIAQRQAWRARQFPPVEQVATGLWSVPVTIPDSPLRYTLAYLIHSDDRVIAVDPGWDSDAGWQDLLRGLAAAGMAPDRVTGIVVTHVHPDHHGLTGG